MAEFEGKYLSDVIDFDTDIAPYRFIKLYAGIGSGKNTFVDHLVRGDKFKHHDGSFVEKQSVLLITSRRAKADEQRSLEDVTYDCRMGMYDDFEFDPFFYLPEDKENELFFSPEILLTDFVGKERKVKARSCCCTNAQVEKIWQSYEPQSTETHPWERFDIIVIDEVHSILTDASYQSAPFYVRRLIEETLSKSSKCKLIVMTGSPEVFENYPLFDDAHSLDLMECCINKTPQKVVFLDTSQAHRELGKILKSEAKAVYFSNTITQLRTIAAKFGKYEANIAMSFSDAVKRNKLKSENLQAYNAMCAVEKSLASVKALPDNVHLFLSTARNKEGINIENPDCRAVFVEAHAESDIKQMAGRLRQGVDTLYIVWDPYTVNDLELAGEESFSYNSTLLHAVNDYYLKLCQKIDYSWDFTQLEASPSAISSLNSYITFIHNKFPYLRFDFASNQFVLYPERGLGRAYYKGQEITFFSCKSKAQCEELVKKWFPNAECEVNITFYEDKKAELGAYLVGKGWLGPHADIKGPQRTELLNKIREITGEDFKSLGPALKRFGYTIESTGHNERSKSTIRRMAS